MTQNISAFVITAGLRDPLILRATLKSVSFVDELVLIDKGQQILPKDVFELCPPLRYCRAKFSPTCEGDREWADSLCHHEWRICLDDDEILSPAAEGFVREAIEIQEASIFQIPIRHHILGRWSEGLLPEWRPALYRCGSIKYNSVVHSGRELLKDQFQLPQDDPVYIDHLSHPNIGSWLEKSDRYTNEPSRMSLETVGSLVENAKRQIDIRSQAVMGDPHKEAVALAVALYDIIDSIKRWEETQPDGDEVFREIAEQVLAR